MEEREIKRTTEIRLLLFRQISITVDRYKSVRNDDFPKQIMIFQKNDDFPKK